MGEKGERYSYNELSIQVLGKEVTTLGAECRTLHPHC